MLDHLDPTFDPKCQLVELSVFSHALELSTNLCKMKISRVGEWGSGGLITLTGSHCSVISQAWQWKVIFSLFNQELFIHGV